MGHESTAINDLIGQVTRKPIQTDRNDWLFGEAPEPTDEMAEDTLPSPSVPAPHPIASPHATHFMRKQTDWRGVMKYLALPLTLFGVVIILLGIYFAKSPSKSAEAHVAHVEAPRVKAVVLPPPPASAPARAEVVPPPAEAPIEPARQVASAELAAAAQPAGSPASRFLAPPPVEQTITAVHAAEPTVAAAPEPIAKVAKPTKAAIKPAAKPRPAPKAKLARHTPPRAKVAPKRATPKVAARDAVAAKPAIDDAPAKAGKGVLSIGSTPPLEVWVDGRSSNAVTPLRVILLAGKHKVTLFDKDHGKAHTFEVEIKPNETLKISKSYQ